MAEPKQFEYESFCAVHQAVTEHLHGNCIKCMPEWLRPAPKVTPAASRNRKRVAG